MSAGIAASNGQFDSAIDLQRRAVQAGPLSLVNRGNLVAYLMMADRLDEAKAEMLHVKELHAGAPEFASLYTRALVLEGRFDFLHVEDAHPFNEVQIGQVFDASGWRHRADLLQIHSLTP